MGRTFLRSSGSTIILFGVPNKIEVKIKRSDRTKQRLLNAVGVILGREGHSRLRVNRIAREAGVSRKLIYDYFGGLSGLIQAYLEQISDSFNEDVSMFKSFANSFQSEVLKDDLFSALKYKFDILDGSKEMQKLILWSLCEKNTTVSTLTSVESQLDKKLLLKADQIFKNSDIDFEATYAILIAAIRYLVLNAKSNKNTICGVNFSGTSWKPRILKTLEVILDWCFAEVASDRSLV